MKRKGKASHGPLPPWRGRKKGARCLRAWGEKAAEVRQCVKKRGDKKITAVQFHSDGKESDRRSLRSVGGEKMAVHPEEKGNDRGCPCKTPQCSYPKKKRVSSCFGPQGNLTRTAGKRREKLRKRISREGSASPTSAHIGRGAAIASNWEGQEKNRQYLVCAEGIVTSSVLKERGEKKGETHLPAASKCVTGRREGRSATTWSIAWFRKKKKKGKHRSNPTRTRNPPLFAKGERGETSNRGPMKIPREKSRTQTEPTRKKNKWGQLTASEEKEGKKPDLRRGHHRGMGKKRSEAARPIGGQGRKKKKPSRQSSRRGKRQKPIIRCLLHKVSPGRRRKKEKTIALTRSEMDRQGREKREKKNRLGNGHAKKGKSFDLQQVIRKKKKRREDQRRIEEKRHYWPGEKRM